MKAIPSQRQNIEALYGYHTTHRPLQNARECSEGVLEEYGRSGFLAIENVLSRDEVAAAKAGLERLIRSDLPDHANVVTYEPGFERDGIPEAERARYVRKLMFFVGHDPVLAALARHPAILSLVERLVGEPVHLIQDMALIKQAHVGTEKPWHQDTAYFLLEPREKIVGVWIALDPATAENGCMHVVPGSQHDGPQPHYHDRDCQLPDDPERASRDVLVPLQPGGALFFSGLLHHGTPPNHSPAGRWALQFHYASIHCRPIDAAEHGTAFHDDEGYAGCAVWATGGVKRPMPAR